MLHTWGDFAAEHPREVARGGGELARRAPADLRPRHLAPIGDYLHAAWRYSDWLQSNAPDVCTSMIPAAWPDRSGAVDGAGPASAHAGGRIAPRGLSLKPIRFRGGNTGRWTSLSRVLVIRDMLIEDGIPPDRI